MYGHGSGSNSAFLQGSAAARARARNLDPGHRSCVLAILYRVAVVYATARSVDRVHVALPARPPSPAVPLPSRGCSAAIAWLRGTVSA